MAHLGSGAEIGRAPIARAAGETAAAEDNQTIWARWDTSAPRAQAVGFLEHNDRWLDVVEALTPERRSSLTVDLGFLAEPVPLPTALGMRAQRGGQPLVGRARGFRPTRGRERRLGRA